MEDDRRHLEDRVAELERRVEVLEHEVVSRQVLDDEIRSLEHRLGELREAES